eukprot:108256-Pyramimonas_sp.AAC.1
MIDMINAINSEIFEQTKLEAGLVKSRLVAIKIVTAPVPGQDLGFVPLDQDIDDSQSGLVPKARACKHKSSCS